MDYKIILISSIFGVGGLFSAVITWLLNRKKMSADITEKIASAASIITTTNQSLITALNDRIQDLESDVKQLTEQNERLMKKLSEIGELILETKGDHIHKSALAKKLK